MALAVMMTKTLMSAFQVAFSCALVHGHSSPYPQRKPHAWFSSLPPHHASTHSYTHPNDCNVGGGKQEKSQKIENEKQKNKDFSFSCNLLAPFLWKW